MYPLRVGGRGVAGLRWPRRGWCISRAWLWSGLRAGWPPPLRRGGGTRGTGAMTMPFDMRVAPLTVEQTVEVGFVAPAWPDDPPVDPPIGMLPIEPDADPKPGALAPVAPALFAAGTLECEVATMAVVPANTRTAAILTVPGRPTTICPPRPRVAPALSHPSHGIARYFSLLATVFITQGLDPRCEELTNRCEESAISVTRDALIGPTNATRTGPASPEHHPHRREEEPTSCEASPIALARRSPS